MPLPAATISPLQSRVLLAVGAGPTASKQLHGTWIVVEEWRWIATRDDSKLRLVTRSVKLCRYDCRRVSRIPRTDTLAIAQLRSERSNET